jgi:galactitol-specific phosphotransferase system IIB component
MNFLILKTIIESTIQNYNHQNPTAKVSENNVSITNLNTKWVDLLIRCPHTNKEVTVRAEVNFMNGPLPTNFSIAGGGMPEVKWQINDTDVTEIRQALKKTTTISDLFGEQ